MTTADKAATGEGNASRWYYTANKNGSFDVFHHDEKAIARLLAEYPNSSAPQWDARVLSNVTEEVAAAHVAMAVEHERANTEREALIGHMFDRTNWKLPTKRARTNNLDVARAMHDALAHYCGGAEIRITRTGYTVGSLGYYHYVGA